MTKIEASMNGISLRRHKYAVGMEGGFFQGYVYIDGKKLGFWSEDPNGGSPHFEFDETLIRDRVIEYYKANPKVDSIKLFHMKPEDVDFDNLPLEDPETGLEIENVFLCELAMLTEMFKFYKKCSKNDLKVLGKIGFIRGPWHNPSVRDNLVYAETVDDIKEHFKEYTDKYPFARVDIYQKPEDFVK